MGEAIANAQGRLQRAFAECELWPPDGARASGAWWPNVDLRRPVGDCTKVFHWSPRSCVCEFPRWLASWGSF
jgi:hypothetical protein